MNLHHFKRSEVIEKGEASIKSFRIIWRYVGIGFIVVSGIIFICAIAMLFLLGVNEFQWMPSVFMGLIGIALLVTGLCFINSSKKITGNPLLEGCKVAEKYVRSYLNGKNRELINDAKREAKRTRKAVPYCVLRSTFDYGKLYKLLKENEEVEYNPRPKILVKYIAIDSNGKYVNRGGTRTFDDNFDDEMFDDLMD